MEDVVDEGLYSRQLYVLGREAMRRVSAAEVLVSGLGGVGAEVAKNLCLGGVGRLTLHDTRLCRRGDLAAQFLLTKDDVGLNRASASAPRLAELNSHVTVSACTCALTDALVRRFDAVVLTEATLAEQLRVSEATHDAGVALVLADARGLHGQLFCDLGERHVVLDADGEPVPTPAAVVSVSRDGVVTTAEETPHGLHEGDGVVLSADGVPSTPTPRLVKRVLGPHAFQLDEPPAWGGTGTGTGTVTQVKVPQTLEFEPLRRSLYAPRFEDWAPRPWQLHLAFATLHRYVEQFGQPPRLWNAHDANTFARLSFVVKNGVRMSEEVDASLMALFAKTCAGVVAPLCAVVGGVAAQEVMKACTGKFTPIRQWLYVDASRGLLHDDEEEHHHDENNLLSPALTSRLANLRVFVVGAGAVGCEVLKNLALLGVATDEDGLISVADADHIERSNLNRQLLFRARDVGRPKAVTAAVAVATLNPLTRVEAHEDAVSQDTEAVFDEDFFTRQHLVVMALDSVAARLYLDQRCVYHRVPALEAGTLGAKGSTQTVVPFLTEAYGSSRDPPERAVPVCTLRNFPSTAEHALLWARELFDARFVEEPEALRRYDASAGPPPQDPEALETLARALAWETPPPDYGACVLWARQLWQDLFCDDVRRLLRAFPRDMATASGRPFWSPPRRAPTPIEEFLPGDPLHADFVFAAANLRARVFGLPECAHRDEVAKMAAAASVRAPPPPGQEEDRDCERPLPPAPPPEVLTAVTPLHFEKDDDANLHVAFVVAAANLRAANYGLEATDRLQGKLVAGRIVPAIATTTAVVAGLLCLELLKVACAPPTLSLEHLSNHYVNLALPMFATSEPRAAPAAPLPGGGTWTLWDRYDVEGDLTLDAFLALFKERHGLTVTMVSHGVRVLYARYLGDRSRDRLGMTLAALLELVAGRPLEPGVRAVALEVSCDDADGNDVDVPYVRYVLPPTSAAIMHQ